MSKTLAGVQEAKELHLGDNRLGDETTAALARALADDRASHWIRVLDLSSNTIKSGGAAALAGFLGSHHCHVQDLELAKCGLKDGSAAAKVEALSSSGTESSKNIMWTGFCPLAPAPMQRKVRQKTGQRAPNKRRRHGGILDKHPDNNTTTRETARKPTRVCC